MQMEINFDPHQAIKQLSLLASAVGVVTGRRARVRDGSNGIWKSIISHAGAAVNGTQKRLKVF